MDQFDVEIYYPRIHIRNHQRTARKTITSIQGPVDLDLHKILRTLRKLLATNGTIVHDELYGDIIQLQGITCQFFVYVQCFNVSFFR